MEIISCHATTSPMLRGTKLFYFLVESVSPPSTYSHLDSLKLKRLHRHRSSRRACSYSNCKHIGPSIINETLNSYVVDGEEGKNVLTDNDQSRNKIPIPSFLEDENGDNVASISSCFWEWKPKLVVHYETSGSENTHSPPVLFLPGFGVGSFHYEKQLKDLGRDYRAWALDFLGQGLSLPVEDPTLQSLGGETDVWGFGDESKTWAKDLAFSVDLWRDQVRYFIEEVIKEPVYLVGNSLGGFVAIYFAACYPKLVKGVTLLNATPFWGFLPNPERSPRLSRIFPWAGTFPLPSSLRKFIEVIWDKISDPRSVTAILKQVYTDQTTKVDEVYSRIMDTTRHPAAAASFASIIFAPQGELSFEESLNRCRINNTPICLVYGKDDPWVRPVWGLQVKLRVPDAPYYEISPAGHCPHDEVPEVVNFLLRGWIKNLESGGSVAVPLLGEEGDVAKELEFMRDGSRKLVRLQFHGGSSFSVWNWLNSQLKALMLPKPTCAR